MTWSNPLPVTEGTLVNRPILMRSFPIIEYVSRRVSRVRVVVVSLLLRLQEVAQVCSV